MSVREATTKESPKKAVVIGGVSAVVVVLAVAWILYVLSPDRNGAQTKAYFTDDDGKTTFVDTIDRIPPFDHDGKSAVRAVLFTADDHRTSFVGFLERYTPEAAAQLKTSQAAVAAGKPVTVNPGSPAIAINGTEFKKPGESKWTPCKNLEARQKLIKSLTPPGRVLDSVLP